MSSTTPVITTQDVGDNIWFGGGLVSFKVTTEQSGGALVLFEHAAAKGKRTPLHLHPDHDETVLLVDGVEYRVGPGAAIRIPRGVPHALLVTSDIARSVWVVTPGGAMEEFF